MSNVRTTTCASSRNVLTKASDEVTIKTYFEGVRQLRIQYGEDAFCVNLDEVWPLAFERKDNAVRALLRNFKDGIDYTTQVLDYQLFRHAEENPLGGRPSVSYYLTVKCLEFLIARNVDKVFEVYRQVFHHAMDNVSSQPQVPQTFSSALKLAYEQALLIEAQNAQIATLTPKADYCDKVLTSQSTFTTTQVAKGYGIPSAMKLNKMLKDHHIMFKQSGQWMPTSDYASKPYWEETTATISLGDDKVRTKKYYKWTELGIKWLREKFGFERHFDYNLAHNDYSDEE